MEKNKVKSKVKKDADFDIFMDGIKMTGDVVRSLIAIRKAKGLTQSDIADRCGIKQSAVARFEARVIIPRFDTVAKYAKAVGEKIVISEKETALTKGAHSNCHNEKMTIVILNYEPNENEFTYMGSMTNFGKTTLNVLPA